MPDIVFSAPLQLLSALLVLLFFLYQYLVFRLIDTILESPKLHKLNKLLIMTLNTVIFTAFVFAEQSTTVLAYIGVFLLYLTEFYVFHKDRLLRTVFVTLAVVVHIMTVRSAVVALYATISGLPFYEVSNTPMPLVMSTLIAFVILNLMAFGVIKLIPAEKIRIINQHQEQLVFMVAWLAVFCGFLVINATTYNILEPYPMLNIFQLFLPITILIGVYIVLFFSMETSTLLGYKEKNSKLEMEIHLEHQYRSSMVSDAVDTYEFNLSQNKLITGFALIQDQLDTDRYDEIIRSATYQQVHRDSIASFLQFSLSDHMIEAYERGQHELMLEYRRLMPTGKYLWMRATTNLIKDSVTGDIKGFTYIRNIDEEKKKQLDLQFKAERDSLTGLYNKGTTAKKISEYIQDMGEAQAFGALFILDVDNFKDINDSFGHTFGDAVLCELGEKLRKLFRDDDIVGRIGGDEFIAFMKNISDKAAIETKAKDICKTYKNIYRGEQKLDHVISASVGVAIAPLHGVTFDTLYRNSDIALYESKNRQKNTYTIYKNEGFTEYKSQRTDIDSMSLMTKKSFKDNRLEYVFKILYGTATSVTAVHSVLELLAAHFEFSRGYIFETSADGQFTANTFEWCAEGIEPQIDNLQNIPIEIIAYANRAFYETGHHILQDIDAISSPEERQILEPQGIKAMLQFGIFDGDKLVGFIGFDDCKRVRIPDTSEVEEISIICNILGTFLLKYRTQEKEEQNSKFLKTIMDNWSSYAYIINKETYQFLFINNNTREITGAVNMTQDTCYDKIRGKTGPCEDCPILDLDDALHSKATHVIYNEKLGAWTESTAGNILWAGDTKACFVNCVDISKYKDGFGGEEKPLTKNEE